MRILFNRSKVPDFTTHKLSNLLQIEHKFQNNVYFDLRVLQIKLKRIDKTGLKLVKNKIKASSLEETTEHFFFFENIF